MNITENQLKLSLIEILSLPNQDSKTDYIRNLYDNECEMDYYGNIKLDKDSSYNKPYLVAHLDNVFEKDDLKLRFNSQGNMLTAFDRLTGQRHNMGADDGVGIAIALELFERYDVGVLLLRDEEIGCIGAEYNEFTDTLNAKYCIEIDRKGSGEIVTNVAGLDLCSLAFKHAIRKRTRRNMVRGGMTDVAQFVEDGFQVSCINMTCGYFNPHTHFEAVHIKEVFNTYNVAKDLIHIDMDTSPAGYYNTRRFSLAEIDQGMYDWLYDVLEDDLAQWVKAK
jgi:di/tripeptidase